MTKLTAQVFAVMYTARTFDNNQLLGPASDDHNILGFLQRNYSNLYKAVHKLDLATYNKFIDDIFNLHYQYFEHDFA